MKRLLFILSLVLALAVLSCMSSGPTPGVTSPSLLSTSTLAAPDREAKIPASAIKMGPENDPHPLVMSSSEFLPPVPVPGAVNTAGAEDSPFITPDGKTLYFFFTPDATMPVEKQLLDGVTGIYVSRKTGDAWGKAERITLQDPGKLALDGCEFVQGNIMLFCTVREGYTGLHWFAAQLQNGIWQNWRQADFNPSFKVGELDISADGNELYFGSDRQGGKGGLDIWVSQKVSGEWQEPVNVAAVNTPDSEGWPALSQDGQELWFTRNYGIWRSKKVEGGWQPPELVVSPLAGEPSLDVVGNLYFVHHYYKNDKMIEADIYVALRKP